MNRSIVSILAVTLGALPLAGCFILIDDDDDCLYEVTGDGNQDALEAAEYFREPDSGQCFFRNTGGPGPIDPCGTDGPQTGAPEPDPAPEYGQCYVACEGLDEPACLVEPGCRTAYLTEPDSDTDAPPIERYYGCWTVSPGATDSFADPDCATLAAYECSLFDVCAAVHTTPCQGGPDFCLEPEVGYFASCRDEGPVAVGCEAQDEAGCVGDPLCEPIYQGDDCVCDAVSCTCNTWTFVECVDTTVP